MKDIPQLRRGGLGLPPASSTSGAAPDHPFRGRFNAALLRLLDGCMHLGFGRRKRRLFAQLPRTVVEIGPGTGANFRYYRPGTKVIAIEPNRYMHDALRRAAARRDLDLALIHRGAENSGLPSASVGAVVGTLVLCTVADPAAVIAETQRILRPGGRFLFLEHVAARPGSPLHHLQRAVHRPWRWCFEGCHTHRDTLASLEAAAWSQLEVERYTARTPLLPINPQIIGVATR